MLLIAVLAIGLLVIPELNSEAKAIPIINPSIHPIKTIAKIKTAISYLNKFGFFTFAILAFKAHKDNPIMHPVPILDILKHHLPHTDNAEK